MLPSPDWCPLLLPPACPSVVPPPSAASLVPLSLVPDPDPDPDPVPDPDPDPAPSPDAGPRRLTRAREAEFAEDCLAKYGIAAEVGSLSVEAIDELHVREFCAHELKGDDPWKDDDGTLYSLKPQGEAMSRKAFKTMLQHDAESEAEAAQRPAKAARRTCPD